MKVELFPFQEIALFNLRKKSAEAIYFYEKTKSSQVISFTAPTGSGKTIIMTSLIESVLYGNSNYPEKPNSIFLWLSDSPELNEQSKMKIETMSDKIQVGQCVTIESENFDHEMLEDGHVYFLNTQKLSTSSNLTKYGNNREFTIWDTIRNTAKNKYDRFYFIIDEAHRGAKSKDIGEATTIMQKFIKGSVQDNIESMPVILGMSATSERFNKLIAGTTSSIHKVIVAIDDVRASGLLKEKIIISYPEVNNSGKDMAVLEAATDEWKRKWEHWSQYCIEQHYSHVNPIFIIQVKNKIGNRISETPLDEALNVIEKRLDYKFKRGEVVHSFGDTESDLTINGLSIPYVNPSRINDDRNIKIVLFKESLSTGWDCPRAETMMSFRNAVDSTYIAQLLGRMIRTPKQMRIQVDETLNEVYLFLPNFNQDNVERVVKDLQSSEGDDLPSEIEGCELGTPTFEIWTVKQNKKKNVQNQIPGQTTLAGINSQELIDKTGESQEVLIVALPNEKEEDKKFPETFLTTEEVKKHDQYDGEQDFTKKKSYKLFEDESNQFDELTHDINREEITRFINESGLLTYQVRKVQITNYFSSLFKLARLLMQSNLNVTLYDELVNDIVQMISNYIKKLKEDKRYDSEKEDLLEFKLSTKTFDPFGMKIEDGSELSLFSSSNLNLERQFRYAEAKLNNEGIGQKYGQLYYDKNNPDEFRVHVILFALNEENINLIHDYSKIKFRQLNDQYRRYIPTLDTLFQNQYEKISSNSDKISKHNFKLPDTVSAKITPDSCAHEDHLLVNAETGFAYIDLNGWEQAVLDEERKRDDFVCWLRNPSRKPWSLQIPYEMNNEVKPMYPDLIIIRRDPILKYVVDVLEPHGQHLVDNVGKAKGLAEYARKNPGLGRIELIRLDMNSSGKRIFYRLDMSVTLIREKVSKIQTFEELNNLFENFG